jgi:tetratricopeptide (TPR) repeat protein
MRRAIIATLVFVSALWGVARAQNECDDLYVKAMQANSATERVKLLKDFLTQCGGKGSQYENFANANLCLTGWAGKTEQETISYGEKAIALGGIDDLTKSQIMMTLGALYAKQASTTEKGRTYANQLIQTATAAKSKPSEAANAAQWNMFIGAGHFILGQASEATKDPKGAIDSYINSYNLLKDPKILAEIKKVGKAQYEAKNYADAQKAFQFAYQVGKDIESLEIVGQCFYKSGKTDEAITVFKDVYARTKSGEMAYNIGILLAKKAESNASFRDEAIRYLLDASFLYAQRAQQARSFAENIYYSADKNWNARVKDLQDRQRLIEDWTKTINSKFGNKSEDDLTPDERREYRKLKENVDNEMKEVEKIQAQQKAVMDGFDKLVNETKQRLGIR